MIGAGSPGVVVLLTHGAVVGMDFMHADMIGDGSPGLVGLSIHSAIVCID